MKNIIVIGAGIGGLIAGNLLVKKGHKVTIFESHSMPGGYTAGFYRNGCYFESGTVSLESMETIFRAMKDIGVLEKLEFAKLGMRVVSDHFDGIPENYEEFKKIIYDAFPADKEKLDKAFSDQDRILSALEGAADMIMPPLMSRIEMLRLLPAYIPNLPKTIKVTREFGKMTSSEFAAKHFEQDSTLYNLFSKFSYPDTSAVFLATAMAGVFTEIWTVRGGMQSWADLLAEKFREQGGDLKLKSYVDRIITANGAVVGVSCSDVVYEADHVISAGDYKKAFLQLLDDKKLIPEELLDSIESAAVSEGFYTVYLVLDIPGQELAEHMKNPHVFSIDFKPGYDIYDTEDGDYFSKTAFYLYSPSMVNPQLAQGERSTLMIQVRTPHRWMDNWGSGNKEIYKQLKAKAMHTMIDRAAVLIPGLKDHIEYMDAATPLTYERFTHNTDGASSAWSWNPKKSFFKSVLGTNVETPVKNLYIGSHWAMQIGGVPGAIAAAYQCVKKIK